MKHITDSAIAKFLDPIISAWGKSEEEIDKLWGPIAEEGWEPNHLGGRIRLEPARGQVVINCRTRLVDSFMYV